MTRRLVGGIIGGTIGGLSLSLLVVAAVVLRRRQCRRSWCASTRRNEGGEDSHPDPIRISNRRLSENETFSFDSELVEKYHCEYAELPTPFPCAIGDSSPSLPPVVRPGNTPFHGYPRIHHLPSHRREKGASDNPIGKPYRHEVPGIAGIATQDDMLDEPPPRYSDSMTDSTGIRQPSWDDMEQSASNTFSPHKGVIL